MVRLTSYSVYGRRSHQNYEANTEHTRVLFGERRDGSVLAGDRKGGARIAGEWRGGVLSGVRGKATALAVSILGSGRDA